MDIQLNRQLQMFEVLSVKELMTLNLILLKPTESDFIFDTSIEPDQPAHPCSLTRLYTVG